MLGLLEVVALMPQTIRLGCRLYDLIVSLDLELLVALIDVLSDFLRFGFHVVEKLASCVNLCIFRLNRCVLLFDRLQELGVLGLKFGHDGDLFGHFRTFQLQELPALGKRVIELLVLILSFIIGFLRVPDLAFHFLEFNPWLDQLTLQLANVLGLLLNLRV